MFFPVSHWGREIEITATGGSEFLTRIYDGKSCWNGSIFCRLNVNFALHSVSTSTSTDGLTWTNEVSLPAVVDPNFFIASLELAWNGSVFCIWFMYDPGIPVTMTFTSPDGISWAGPYYVPGIEAAPMWVVGGNFFMAKDFDARNWVSSPDGINWTPGYYLSPPVPYPPFANVAHPIRVSTINSCGVGSNNSYSIAYYKKATWSLHPTSVHPIYPKPSFFFGTYGGESTPLVANNGTLLGRYEPYDGSFSTSSDGDTWSLATSPPVIPGYPLGGLFGERGFFFVWRGPTGNISYSTDGTTWITVDTTDTYVSILSAQIDGDLPPPPLSFTKALGLTTPY